MQKFLRTMLLMALVMVPWATQAQNAAKVSEYDNEVVTAAYATIAGNGGTAWSQGAYVDVAMPFAMQFGENQVASGTNLRVYPDGHAEFVSLAGSQLAPLYLDGGYTTTATSIYTKSNSTGVTVEWRKVVSGSNSYSFQLVLLPTGVVEFHYGPMTISSSINVLVGMMGSATDIYRVGGADGTNDWAGITRYTSGTTTRALSAAYHPAYDATAAQGLVYRFTQPACVKPNTFTATAASSSSISLAWTVNDAGVKYEIKYSTDETFDPETEGTQQWVNTSSATSATISGLAANTTYYIALRKYCDANTPSGWIMAEATTDCGPYTAADLPIFEDFDSYTASTSATIHRCWTKVYGYSGSHTNYPYPSTSQHHSGTKALYFYSSTTASYRSWVAIPYSGAMNNICVNLWALKTSASYGYLQVGVMSDPDDFSTFELVQDISFTSGATNTWYNMEAYFDGYTGTGNYIVILAPSGASNYVYVDDITISTLPACRRITNLAINDEMLLTWNGHGGNAFEVKYDDTDFDPETEGTAIAVTTTSFQLADLESSTTYYVYVRSSCSDSWQKVVFTTPCTAMTLTMTSPYIENFDSYTSSATSSSAPTGYPLTHSMPLCWSFLNMSSSTSTYPQMFLTAYSSYAVSGKCLFFKSSSTTPAYAILPKFTNNIQALQINYTYRNEGTGTSNGTLYMGYMTDPTDETTFVPLQECDQITTKTPMEYSFAAAGVTGNNYYIAFRYTGGSSNNYYLAIDDVEVSLIPSCAKPVNLTASNITDQAVTLSWTEASATPATQWQVKIGEPGFDPATSGRSVIANGTPTTTVAGLTMTTEYEAYVRAICGDGDTSAWSAVCGFSTICMNGGPVSIGNGTSANSYFPFYSYYKYSLTQQIYTADEMGGANTFYGLSFQQAGTATPTRTIDVYLAETDKTSFESNTDWIPSSQMTLVYSGPYTSAGQGWNSITFTTPFVYSGTGNVVVCIDDNTGSYVTGRTHYTHTAGSNTCIRIYSDGTNYDPSAPSSYSGTRAATRNNIKFDSPCLVSCNAPQALNATLASSSSVQLTWSTLNTETPANAVVVYGAPGFDPYSEGTRMVLPGSSVSATINGLTEKTAYDAYVYYVCSSTDSSAMTKVSFTTPCDNACYDSIYMYDSYGDGWESHTIDLYVNGNLSAQYTIESGSENTAMVQLCPNDQIQFVWHQNGGSMYGENDFEIYNHEGELIYSCEAEAGLYDGIVLWQGRACFTPNCHTPNALTASNITYTSATLDWTETTTPAPTQWVLGYISENDAEPTYISINTKPYTLTGLTANTNYAFIVRAVCQPGVDSSDWSNTAYFYTGYCQPAPSSVDNNGMTNIVFGDNLVVDTDTTFGLTYADFTNLVGDAGQGTNAEVAITYGTNYTYNTYVWVDWNNDLDFDDDGELVFEGESLSDNPTTLNATFTVPATTALGDYRMRVGGGDSPIDACYTGSWACLFDFTLRVTPAPTCYKPTALAATTVYGKQAVLTWTENTPTPATKWQLAYTNINEGNTLYQIATAKPYTLNGLVPETEYEVMVRAICGAGDTSNWSAPVTFTTTPSCWAPTGLAGTATANSATLSWTENTLPTAATRWQVAYGLNGTFDLSDESTYTTVEATTNSAFVVTGLKHSSSYQMAVRAVCDPVNEDYSPWSNVVTIATACGAWVADELPIAEDFESYSSGLPPCWEHIGAGTGQVVSPTSTTSINGARALRFSGATTNNIVTLPAVNDPDDTLVFAFYTRPESFTNANCGSFDAGYVTDKSDTSSFVALETYAYSDFTVAEQKEIQLVNFPAGAFPAFRHRANSTSWYWFVDDVVVKVLEHTNVLADNGGTVTACNEYVMPDTTSGMAYHNNVNATYVINPAEVGKVVALNGSYNLEDGYDFVYVYEGTGANKVLKETLTGKGTLNYKSESNDWVNKGAVTLVFTSDADNAMTYDGFKFLVDCVCPEPAADTLKPVVEANGTYAWINGETYTNNYTDATLNADLEEEVFYAQPNVAGCDSVYHLLTLTVHPTYTLTYSAEICERDTFDFYGRKFTTTGTYPVTLQTVHGADSTGILNLQMHEAPTAGIYYNKQEVTTVDAFCDNAAMTLVARSHNASATFLWEDSSTVDTRTVYPHESNTYTVVATDPAYGCTSLPATVTVTTTPVPALTLSGDTVICVGQSATLTLTDANNVDATYRWNTGATTASITVNPQVTTTYTATATTTNASACAVSASITVVVNPLPVVELATSVSELCLRDSVDLTATVVDGYSYAWNTGANTAATRIAPASTGNYTVTVTDGNGCVKEFTTATVTVHPSYELNDTMAVCYTQNPYTWGAQTLTEDGNYDQTFTIAHGCDSTVHLSFEFRDMATINAYRELCQSTPYVHGGNSYIANADTVLHYVSTPLDCPVDSVLYLTVNMPAASAFERTVCDSTDWNGTTYTESGEFTQVLKTTKGCDSTVVMTLTVNYHTFAERSEVTCDSLQWNAETYYEVGDYVQHFAGADVNGCDSTETLHLTAVNHATTGVDDILWCATRSYTWIDGHTYTLTETSGDVTYKLAELNAQGCDTTAILNLVMNYVTDTSLWVDIDTCDEYVVDTVACDNTVAPAYLRESGDYQLRTHNATTGRDQISRIHLTVTPSTYQTTVVDTCVPYTWIISYVSPVSGNDTTYNVGTYNPVAADTVISFDMAEAGITTTGCSDIRVLRLHARRRTVGTEEMILCQNESGETFNHTAINAANYLPGTYNVPLTTTTVNDEGCAYDSTLVLTVNPIYNVEDTLVLCESQFDTNFSYTYVNPANDMETVELTIDAALNGTVYTNTVTAYWQSATGCDSIVNFFYTVNPTTYETVTEATCDTYTWELNRQKYDKTITVDYLMDGANQYGCDSIVTLDLTIYDSLVVYDTINVCTTYEGPDGKSYRETMTFREVFDGATAEGCDSIVYTTYNVVQRALIVQNVVTNAPYEWNGTTYTASANNLQWVGATVDGCDSLVVMNLTINDAIEVCEDNLPYTATYGFVLDTDAVSGVYEQHSVISNIVDTLIDTVIYYTINYNVTSSIAETACDSYEWHGNVYTTSGEYTFDTIAANGCDSTATLTLTVNYNTNSADTVTMCDSYTWNNNGWDTTYTTSGTYTHAYAATNECPSVDTLYLTINVNEPVIATVTACDSYVWTVTNNAANDTLGTYTVSGEYGVEVTDANGCTTTDSLYLTINTYLTGERDSVVNAAFTYYNNTYYEAGTHVDIIDTLVATNGCDSILTTHLTVQIGSIINDSINGCGVYTWIDGNEYEWIPASQRVNPMFNYKNRTTGASILENPTYSTFVVDPVSGDSVIDETHVLWLNMTEAGFMEQSLGCFYLTPANYTLTVGNDTLGLQDLDLSAYLTGTTNFVLDTMVRHNSTYYCENLVTYHINLIVNNQTALTDTACESYTWFDQTYTASGDYSHTLTGALGCDSVLNLALVVKPAVHNVDVVDNVCDTYTWHDTAYTTSGTYTYSYANANGCTNVDTLKLTLGFSTTATDVQTACDTYTWIDNIVYTASNDSATFTLTNAAGCDSVVTLNLTVNNSIEKDSLIEVLGSSYTLNGVRYTAPYDDFIDVLGQTVAGCDSLVHVHLVLSPYVLTYDNVEACGVYTWSYTGHTYMWISDEESAANSGALYRDITAGEYVYANNLPSDTQNVAVTRLNLTIFEAAFDSATIERFPLSQQTLTLGNNTFDYSAQLAAKTSTTVNEIAHFGSSTMCDSIVFYTINLVYNYDTIEHNVCADSINFMGNTEWNMPNTNQTYWFVETVNAGTADEQVTTHKVYRRAYVTGTDAQTVCDVYDWNGTEYTTSGEYEQTLTDVNGCDSVVTLTLTVNHNTSAGTTVTACDSYEWHDSVYTVSDTYYYSYNTTVGNCPSVDTLYLTINVNEGTKVVDTVCDSYTWVANNNTVYTTSGTYYRSFTGTNTCPAIDTLVLTVNQSVHVAQEVWVSEAYRSHGQMLTPGNVYNFIDTIGVTVNGCDSIHDSTIHVGSAFYAAEQVVSCNSYTWRDGNTYVWISDEERAANGNALYKNQTTGEYVLYAPTFAVPQEGNYDSIYALMLTLTQNYVGTDEVTVMVSANTFQYGDSIIDFSAANTRAHNLIGFNDSTIIRDVHFNAVQYCDSVINLTLHVVNNYYGDEDAHICVSNTTFEWRGESYNVATNYYDSLTIDTLYKTSGDSIYYIKVYQHPFVYATERRTACDEYVWNGRTFTESTSNATAILPDQYGCDSTVTLILTILNNSNDTTEAVACGTYDWNTVDGHVFTFTHSVDTVYNYTATNGCPSVDTLHLTINPVYTVTAAETVCDSYVWGDTTITTSGTYTKTFPSINGCDSTVTLTLTVKTNSNHGDSIVACGEYEWHDSVYTMSDTYFFEYEAANGCASVDTLYLTINPVYTRNVEVCDSLRWGGELYTDAGEYTHTFTTNNVCDSIVTINLMVNRATHNVETVASCLTYTWNNNVYTTSGVKTYEYINDEGCASVDTLHLTIGTGRTFAIQNVTNCGPYTWIVNDSTIDTFAESVETSTEFVNPATGCDSVVYLNLTVKHAPVVDTTDVICETALPYTWRGTIMTAAGVEEVTFPQANGCDSTIRFTLTVNPTLTTTVNDNVCLGLGYNANGFDVNAADLAESGVYTFVKTFSSVETGCDSIVTLNLTVGDLLTTMTEVTACDSYVWTAGDGNDYTYNETGTYFTEAYNNAQGCKSVDTLRLTINVNSSTAYTASACDSYEWNGTVYDATGIYTYDYTDNNGCASTDTLHLTISSSVANLTTEVACDSYEWHGTVYTTSGTYVYEYTTTDNCSGTDTLVLTVNNSTSSEETATACDSYTWNGETYTTSGTYTYTTTNAANCDSIVTLNLTIGNSNTGIDEQIACDTYTWIDGNTYTASNNTATYTLVNAAGCDSVVTLNLTVNASTESAETAEACVSYTWNGETYTQSGVYTFTTTNAAGCDSTVTLTLTVNQPTAGTEIAEACNSYEWNGTNYTQSGVFTFETVNANGCDSTATLVLTIKRPVYATINQTVCGSYTWTDGTGETYTTSGNYTYTATAANGCDSIVTLVLTVNQPVATTVTATACESYTWNNTVYNTTGSYTQTLTAHNGCDSTVTLNLTINQPTTATVAQTACGSYTWNGQTYTTSGTYTYTTTNANGCDSTVTLTLTVNQPMNTTEIQTACGSYTWNGQTYTTSGTYTNDIIDVNGCTATATLYLTVLQPANSTETITVCDNYIWNGQLYTMSGTYTNTFVDVNGCNATATLNLTVNASSTSVESTTVCGSYTWNGQTYTTSGTYSFQTDNAAGCDSTALLNLTVNQPVYTTEAMVACDSYTWNGETYTTSGEYTYTTSAANGCDSIVTLVLTVNNSVTNSIEVTACNSYLWNDVVYTTSGEYTQVLTAHNGCDSTVTLTLTIATSMFVAETVSACDSYEWNGTVYTESGSYTWNGTSVYGCDSTMTLTLTVNHSADTTIFMQGEGSVEWNGETFTESGVYERVLSTVTGCDSVVTLVLSILPEGVPAPYLYNVMDVALMINHNDEGMEDVHYIWYRWYRNGELVLEGPDKDSYSEEGRKLNGCYYLEVATDESLEFWVRSNEVCITSEGIDDVAEFDFTIAPNPVLRGSIVNVSVEAGASDLQGAEIRIFDVQGRQIHQQMNNGTIVADFATGMYMVRLSLNDGRTAVRRLIVK